MGSGWNLYIYVCEREKQQHEITLIIFKLYKKCKTAEILTKTSFFLYFRDSPKNGEGNKQKRR